MKLIIKKYERNNDGNHTNLVYLVLRWKVSLVLVKSFFLLVFAQCKLYVIVNAISVCALFMISILSTNLDLESYIVSKTPVWFCKAGCCFLSR